MSGLIESNTAVLKALDLSSCDAFSPQCPGWTLPGRCWESGGGRAAARRGCGQERVGAGQHPALRPSRPRGCGQHGPLLYAAFFLTSKSLAREERELLCGLWKVVGEEAELSSRGIYGLFYCLIGMRVLRQKYSLEAELSERVSVCSTTFCSRVVYLLVELRVWLELVVSWLESLLRPFG